MKGEWKPCKIKCLLTFEMLACFFFFFLVRCGLNPTFEYFIWLSDEAEILGAVFDKWKQIESLEYQHNSIPWIYSFHVVVLRLYLSSPAFPPTSSISSFNLRYLSSFWSHWKIPQACGLSYLYVCKESLKRNNVKIHESENSQYS